MTSAPSSSVCRSKSRVANASCAAAASAALAGPAHPPHQPLQLPGGAVPGALHQRLPPSPAVATRVSARTCA